MSKTIDEKITDHFSDFSLSIPEKYAKNKLYLYADYIELVALFYNEEPVSVGEIMSRFRDEGIFAQRKSDENKAEKDHENETFVRNIFSVLDEHKSLFSNSYPFEYEDEKLSLKASLTHKNKLYLFLLLASNLSTFKIFQSNLSSEFETISYEALKKYLPETAVTKSFGADSEFKGYFNEKITQLAALMNVDADHKFLDTFSPKNTKDGGLDIVSWLPFEDQVSNFISVFAQCACGKDWKKKLNETRSFNRVLKVYLNKINHSLFIPYALINYHKSEFYEHHEFGEDTLVFERKRILSLIDENLFDQLDSKILIEKCIDFEEDIV